MKTLSYLVITFCAVVFMACNGGSQQPAVVPASQQPAPAEQATPGADAAQQPQAASAAQAQGLPQGVTSFLNNYFPGTQVVGYDTDREFGGMEYDVTLNDGTEIDFDSDNQWESIDCKVKAVPNALVPAAISKYVAANYQSLPISKISNKRSGYEVELTNGLELRFDKNGSFVGMDD